MPRKPHHSDRRGAVLILFLVLFPLLILIVGFSIDYAHMQRARTELRRGTDLAAKAAALSLALDTDESIALQTAIDVAKENDVAGAELKLAASDVIFGTSRKNDDGSFRFISGGSPRNSVQIVGSRTEGSLSGPVSTYFGALYNSPTFEPQFSATAAFVNTDICLVLDRSSSMKWKVIGGSQSDVQGDRCVPPNANSRWVALEEAVNAFIDVMENSPAIQKVAMVSFATEVTACGNDFLGVEVDVPLSKNFSPIRTAMADRAASTMSGNTDIALGIQEGQKVLTGSGARSTAYKFMIVMTDGRYTEDDPTPYAAIAAANDIQVYTITFSDGASKDDMIAVADAGHGVHYHADSTADLITVFESLAGTISKVIE